MFKAWDKNHKCFWYELPIGFELKLNGKIFLYDMPTEEMQLVRKTGLQDVNGKDIYEGDIIERITDVEIWKDFGFVFFKELGQVGFALKTKDSYSGINSNYKYKIIGNIYENPELLEQGRVVTQAS